ncbi:hypothetical protein JQM68_12195 [Oscillibacter valericigenes]|uniref:hypothetical protein n=1 Tax=Oscillibacter valericigenes TaxID=351091 RepID=UPI001F21136C|nr:hypothetical protein [Oscillibacter valericigenes]MCF2617946.1 hypothetical protein [Oscillibacter valericigenes]
MEYKHSCVVDSGGVYQTLVLVLIYNNAETPGEKEELLNYRLKEDEALLDVQPPVLRPCAGADGLVKPRWDDAAAQWEESASQSELSAWEAAHPAPEILMPGLSDSQRIEELETLVAGLLFGGEGE